MNLPEQRQLTLPFDEFQLRNQPPGYQMSFQFEYPQTTPDKIFYTWQEVDEDVRWLGKAIIASGFKPDLIVGLARGGLIPAVMLSHMLNVPFKTLTWSTRDYAKQDTSLWYALTNNYTSILVVDDIVDSGLTISGMMASTATTANVKVAALWYNVHQKIANADYIKRTINREYDERWVVFPFEVENEYTRVS